jgi:hypothetical protein
LHNLSSLPALNSSKEGIWHSNGDTRGQIFCLKKLRLQDGNMICHGSEMVVKTNTYRLSRLYLQLMPAAVHGTNSAQ